MKRPGELYQSSSRKLPKRIERYEYPAHYLVRRVSRAGTIRVFHNQIFVSNTLHGDYVGLEEVDDGVHRRSTASTISAAMSCRPTKSTILCLKRG